MGYDFLLKKSASEKLCRARKQIEKLGSNPGLEAALTPSNAVVQFRCQGTDGPLVKKGDPVLIFSSGTDVQILKQNRAIGAMTPPAASDFNANFTNRACPEYQLGEVVSDPSSLDKSFDVEIRPPWTAPEPKPSSPARGFHANTRQIDPRGLIAS